MIHYLTIGIVLGISAGITPGPLLALVLSESLQHGVKAGMKVAVAPIFSDIPIVFLTLYVLSRLSHFHGLLGGISILGGVFLLFLGISHFRIKELTLKPGGTAPKSFTKGIVVNALNPHPYLFWFTVGAPIAQKALSEHSLLLIPFLGGFYGAFAGAKAVMATVAGRSRRLINNTLYKYIMWFLGVLLCVLAVMFFRDGIRLLSR